MNKLLFEAAEVMGWKSCSKYSVKALRAAFEFDKEKTGWEKLARSAQHDARRFAGYRANYKKEQE